MTTADGEFSLTGVHGIAFSVRASKDGYYTTDQSRGHRNVTLSIKGDNPQPTNEQPIVLVMRKQGKTVPLIFTRTGQIEVPTTGEPVHINLSDGHVGAGDFLVAAWIADTAQRKYDWRYQLSVAGGGLIERTGPFEFEAPIEGYQPSLDYSMAATSARWSFDGQGDYFVKLADGRYARLSIRYYPRQHRNFLVMEIYLNPAPNNRNLEYDPKQKTNAP